MVVELGIDKCTRDRLKADAREMRTILNDLIMLLEGKTDEDDIFIHEKQVSAIKGLLEWKKQIVVYNLQRLGQYNAVDQETLSVHYQDILGQIEHFKSTL